MDGVFHENFGGVVRHQYTRISGAVVYLYESAIQRCKPCTNLPDLRLVTDKDGRFQLPDNIVLEQTYLVDVFIFADGCELYHETVTASSLQTSYDWENNQPILILSYFELICTSDILTPTP